MLQRLEKGILCVRDVRPRGEWSVGSQIAFVQCPCLGMNMQ